MLDESKLPLLLEAIILTAQKPMTEEAILAVFKEHERPTKTVLREALNTLEESCMDRGIQLVQIASGYQFQAKPEWNEWLGTLFEEKAPRYSRALLETLALIAYRQPITRGDIEDIRGVSVSTSIFKTLQEDREWIRVVGHREVPGRPALYATTKNFLDYFGLNSLEQLPPLPEIMNLETIGIGPDLALENEFKRVQEHNESLQVDVPDVPEENGIIDETLNEEEALVVTHTESAEEISPEEVLEEISNVINEGNELEEFLLEDENIEVEEYPVSLESNDTDSNEEYTEEEIAALSGLQGIDRIDAEAEDVREADVEETEEEIESNVMIAQTVSDE